MSRLLTALCGVALLATAAQAQTVRPGNGKVHRLEINNGLTQTVRYYGDGLRPNEQATLRDLERLENEALYARSLLDIKKQYVASERVLEPQRRRLLQQQYSTDLVPTVNLPVAYGGYGYYGGFAGGVGAPVVYPGYTYTNYAPAAVTLSSYAPRAADFSGLDYSLSLPTPVKDAMARTLAGQATPEYFASLERGFDQMLQRASASPTLRASLGLTTPSRAERLERPRGGDGIRTVAGEAGGAILLTLKSGETLTGSQMTEKGDWIILDRGKAGRVRVRASEVVRIDEAPAGNIRKATD